jgi:hypothetical protein
VPANHQPPAVPPGAAMGAHPVIIRLQWPDGDEWRPAMADRWTTSEARVSWRGDDGTERHCWLPVADVARVLRQDPRLEEADETDRG